MEQDYTVVDREELDGFRVESLWDGRRVSEEKSVKDRVIESGLAKAYREFGVNRDPRELYEDAGAD